MEQALLNMTAMREIYLLVWKCCTDSMTATLICHWLHFKDAIHTQADLENKIKQIKHQYRGFKVEITPEIVVFLLSTYTALINSPPLFAYLMSWSVMGHCCTVYKNKSVFKNRLSWIFSTLKLAILKLNHISLCWAAAVSLSAYQKRPTDCWMLYTAALWSILRQQRNKSRPFFKLSYMRMIGQMDACWPEPSLRGHDSGSFILDV